MVPAILEKFGYVTTLMVLFATGRISALDAQPAWPDLALGLLFVSALSPRGRTCDIDNR